LARLREVDRSARVASIPRRLSCRRAPYPTARGSERQGGRAEPLRRAARRRRSSKQAASRGPGGEGRTSAFWQLPPVVAPTASDRPGAPRSSASSCRRRSRSCGYGRFAVDLAAWKRITSSSAT